MLSRLLGLETEYAIRFTPSGASPTPRNDAVYDALATAVSSRVSVRPGRRRAGRKQIFLENGGSLYYEFLPTAPGGGLLEAATPECRGASQLLLYQRAQEALLAEAIPQAERLLRARGFAGSVGLLKNCRDAEGHIYGTQENFEVELARGPWLWLWRFGLIALLPVLAVTVFMEWLVVALLFVLTLGCFAAAGFAALLLPSLRRTPTFRRLMDEGEIPVLERVLGRVSVAIEHAVWWPLVFPFTLLMRAVAFRRLRRSATAFLVSRPVVTGAGTLGEDGRFGLSERGPDIRALMRRSISPGGRSVYDALNLVKDLMSPLTLRFGPLRRLFSPRQRLQIGLSDANMAQVAELLKIGTTCLIFDMSEAGALDDAPQLREPLKALQDVVSDPTLGATFEAQMGDGTRREMTALEIQRWYLERARAYLRDHPAPAMEAHTLLRLWGEVLDALEADPGRLVGTLDWVSKRYLLETAGGELDAESRKKIDLKYHELSAGYFAELERAGLAQTLVDPGDRERAVREPPDATPAKVRGRLVRELANHDGQVAVSWDTVEIGGRLRGTVISLDDFR